MPFSGVDQFQHSYSPYPNMQQPGDPYFNPGASTSPMGIRSPYPVHQGMAKFPNKYVLLGKIILLEISNSPISGMNMQVARASVLLQAGFSGLAIVLVVDQEVEVALILCIKVLLLLLCKIISLL